MISASSCAPTSDSYIFLDQIESEIGDRFVQVEAVCWQSFPLGTVTKPGPNLNPGAVARAMAPFVPQCHAKVTIPAHWELSLSIWCENGLPLERVRDAP